MTGFCAVAASMSLISASPARVRLPSCEAPSRAQAEDIADTVAVDYEELEPVVDMLAAREADAPLVHEEWGDNVFIEFFQDGAIERVAEAATIKVTRDI